MMKIDTKNKELLIKTLAIILLIVSTPYYMILLPKVFLGFAAIYSSPDDMIAHSSMMILGFVAAVGMAYNSYKMIIEWNNSILVIFKESIFLLFLLLIYINTLEEPTGVIIDYLESLI
ncbi:hypothetical protein CP985_14125 [Malaciobacter mytili LMG 24559]|uniref:Uncharacterized protein n=1 Tax=Malaciobacter mytili LMG 24559 TaxID=1032238 RepID=A0AAX2ADY6_9BACT|nr:hypothetical protein [Malaciobacter mytili]AXH16478.1 putative membrane protein [Malaciobacter mytili LMG 24559]RXK12884.1 hypothetical protein CP985_14125 [Malaciobacter mytili LMG 24559]